MTSFDQHGTGIEVAKVITAFKKDFAQLVNGENAAILHQRALSRRQQHQHQQSRPAAQGTSSTANSSSSRAEQQQQQQVIPPRSQLKIRLPGLLRELAAKPLVSTSVLAHQILYCANHLMRARKWRIAAWCYTQYLSKQQPKPDKHKDNDQHNNQPVAADDSTPKEDTHGADAPSAQHQQNHVLLVSRTRAIYALSECQLHDICEAPQQHDLRNKHTVERCVQMAHRVKHAMNAIMTTKTTISTKASDPAAGHERASETLCWLLYNGTLLLYRFAEVFMQGGCAVVANPLLRWALLCMEASPPLCSATYLPWRVRLYVAVAKCFEAAGEFQRARRSVVRCTTQVKQVAKMVAVDPPVLSSTADMLLNAERHLRILFVKYSFCMGVVAPREVLALFIKDASVKGKESPGVVGTVLRSTVELLDGHSRIFHVVNSIVNAFCKHQSCSAPGQAQQQRDEQQQPVVAAVTLTGVRVHSWKTDISRDSPMIVAATDVPRQRVIVTIVRWMGRKCLNANVSPRPDIPRLILFQLLCHAFSCGSWIEYLVVHYMIVTNCGNRCGAATSVSTTDHDGSVGGREENEEERALLLKTHFLFYFFTVMTTQFPAFACEAVMDEAVQLLHEFRTHDASEQVSSEASGRARHKRKESKIVRKKNMPNMQDAKGLALEEARIAQLASIRADGFSLLQGVVDDAVSASSSTNNHLLACCALMRQLCLMETMRVGNDDTKNGPGDAAVSTMRSAVMPPSRWRDALVDAALYLWHVHCADLLTGNPVLFQANTSWLPSADDEKKNAKEGSCVSAPSESERLIPRRGDNGSSEPEEEEKLTKDALIVLLTVHTVFERCHVEDALLHARVVQASAREVLKRCGLCATKDECTQLQEAIVLVDQAIDGICRFRAESVGEMNSEKISDVGIKRCIRSRFARDDLSRVDTAEDSCGDGSLLYGESLLMHMELLMIKYKMVLLVSRRAAHLSARRRYNKFVEGERRKLALTATYEKQLPDLVLPQTNKAAERSLLHALRDNPYESCILLVQMASLRVGMEPDIISERDNLLSRAMAALNHADKIEQVLLRAHGMGDEGESTKAGTVNAVTRESVVVEEMNGVAVNGPSTAGTHCLPGWLSTVEQMTGHIAQMQLKIERAPVPAPTIVARTVTSITLRIRMSRSFIQSFGVQSCVVYGKLAGTGVDVIASPDNAAFEGLGEEISIGECVGAARDECDVVQVGDVVVSGLTHNRSYVFAVAAVDANGNNVSGIGETSIPISVILPLPVCALWGEIALAARKLGARSSFGDGSERFVTSRSYGCSFEYVKIARNAANACIAPFLKTKDEDSPLPSSTGTGEDDARYFPWGYDALFQQLDMNIIVKTPRAMLRIILAVLHVSADVLTLRSIRSLHLSEPPVPPPPPKNVVEDVNQPRRRGVKTVEEEKVVWSASEAATIMLTESDVPPNRALGYSRGRGHVLAVKHVPLQVQRGVVQALSPLSLALNVAIVLYGNDPFQCRWLAVVQTAERLFNALLHVLHGSDCNRDDVAATLPMMLACFRTVCATRSALPFPAWPPSVEVMAARLCHSLVSFYGSLGESNAMTMVLEQHLSAVRSAFFLTKSAVQGAVHEQEVRTRIRADAEDACKRDIEEYKESAEATAAALRAGRKRKRSRSGSRRSAGNSPSSRPASKGRVSFYGRHKPSASDVGDAEEEAFMSIAAFKETAEAKLAQIALPGIAPSASDFSCLGEDDRALASTLLCRSDNVASLIGETLMKHHPDMISTTVTDDNIDNKAASDQKSHSRHQRRKSIGGSGRVSAPPVAADDGDGVIEILLAQALRDVGTEGAFDLVQGRWCAHVRYVELMVRVAEEALRRGLNGSVFCGADSARACQTLNLYSVWRRMSTIQGDTVTDSEPESVLLWKAELHILRARMLRLHLRQVSKLLLRFPQLHDHSLQSFPSERIGIAVMFEQAGAADAALAISTGLDGEPRFRHGAHHLGWEWALSKFSHLQPATLRIPSLPKADNYADDDTVMEEHDNAQFSKGKNGRGQRGKEKLHGHRSSSCHRRSSHKLKIKQHEEAPRVVDPLPPDLDSAEQLMYHRLANGAALACRIRAWLKVQNACRLMWNCALEREVTAEYVAVRSHPFYRYAQRHAAAVTAVSASLEDTGDAASPRDKFSAMKKFRETSLLRSFHLAAVALVSMVEYARNEPKEVSSPFAVHQLSLNNDIIPQLHRAWQTLWFSTRPDLNMSWTARFIVFGMQCMYHAQEWENVIDIGLRFNSVTDNAFCDLSLKYMILAQEALYQRVLERIESTNDGIDALTAQFEYDVAAIQEVRSQRRSQRAKRVEDEKLHARKSEYDLVCGPLRVEKASLEKTLAAVTERFEALGKVAVREHDETPAWALLLQEARYKLWNLFRNRRRQLLRGGRPDSAHSVASFASLRSQSSRGSHVSERLSRLSVSLSSHKNLLPPGAASDVDGLNAFAYDQHHAEMGTGDKMSVASSHTGTRQTDGTRVRGVGSVAATYRRALRLIREQGESVAECRALLELAGFYYEEKQNARAAVCWRECLDSAFGTMHVLEKDAAEVVADFNRCMDPRTRDMPSVDVFHRCGLWNCISGAIAAYCLAQYEFTHKNILLRERAVTLGATLLSSIGSSQYGRPQCARDYADYTITGDLFAGQSGDGAAGDLLNVDPFRVKIGHLLDAARFFVRDLILYMGQPVDALPLCCIYEYLSSRVCGSVFHATQARIWKGRALLDAGYWTSASRVVGRLLCGRDLGFDEMDVKRISMVQRRSSGLNVPDAVASGGSKKQKQLSAAYKRKGDKSGGGLFSGSGGEVSSDDDAYFPLYHGHLLPESEENQAFLAFLTGDAGEIPDRSSFDATAVEEDFSTLCEISALIDAHPEKEPIDMSSPVVQHIAAVTGFDAALGRGAKRKGTTKSNKESHEKAHHHASCRLRLLYGDYLWDELALLRADFLLAISGASAIRSSRVLAASTDMDESVSVRKQKGRRGGNQSQDNSITGVVSECDAAAKAIVLCVLQRCYQRHPALEDLAGDSVVHDGVHNGEESLCDPHLRSSRSRSGRKPSSKKGASKRSSSRGKKGGVVRAPTVPRPQSAKRKGTAHAELWLEKRGDPFCDPRAMYAGDPLFTTCQCYMRLSLIFHRSEGMQAALDFAVRSVACLQIGIDRMRAYTVFVAQRAAEAMEAARSAGGALTTEGDREHMVVHAAGRVHDEFESPELWGRDADVRLWLLFRVRVLSFLLAQGRIDDTLRGMLSMRADMRSVCAEKTHILDAMCIVESKALMQCLSPNSPEYAERLACVKSRMLDVWKRQQEKIHLPCGTYDFCDDLVDVADFLCGVGEHGAALLVLKRSFESCLSSLFYYGGITVEQLLSDGGETLPGDVTSVPPEASGFKPDAHSRYLPLWMRIVAIGCKLSQALSFGGCHSDALSVARIVSACAVNSSGLGQDALATVEYTIGMAKWAVVLQQQKKDLAEEACGCALYETAVLETHGALDGASGRKSSQLKKPRSKRRASCTPSKRRAGNTSTVDNDVSVDDPRHVAILPDKVRCSAMHLVISANHCISSGHDRPFLHSVLMALVHMMYECHIKCPPYQHLSDVKRGAWDVAESTWWMVYFLVSACRVADMQRVLVHNVAELGQSELLERDLLPAHVWHEIGEHLRLRCQQAVDGLESLVSKRVEDVLAVERDVRASGGANHDSATKGLPTRSLEGSVRMQPQDVHIPAETIKRVQKKVREQVRVEVEERFGNELSLRSVVNYYVALCNELEHGDESFVGNSHAVFQNTTRLGAAYGGARVSRQAMQKTGTDIHQYLHECVGLYAERCCFQHALLIPSKKVARDSGSQHDEAESRNVLAQVKSSIAGMIGADFLALQWVPAYIHDDSGDHVAGDCASPSSESRTPGTSTTCFFAFSTSSAESDDVTSSTSKRIPSQRRVPSLRPSLSRTGATESQCGVAVGSAVVVRAAVVGVCTKCVALRKHVVAWEEALPEGASPSKDRLSVSDKKRKQTGKKKRKGARNGSAEDCTVDEAEASREKERLTHLAMWRELLYEALSLFFGGKSVALGEAECQRRLKKVAETTLCESGALLLDKIPSVEDIVCLERMFDSSSVDGGLMTSSSKVCHMIVACIHEVVVHGSVFSDTEEDVNLGAVAGKDVAHSHDGLSESGMTSSRSLVGRKMFVSPAGRRMSVDIGSMWMNAAAMDEGSGALDV